MLCAEGPQGTDAASRAIGVPDQTEVFQESKGPSGLPRLAQPSLLRITSSILASSALGSCFPQLVWVSQHLISDETQLLLHPTKQTLLPFSSIVELTDGWWGRAQIRQQYTHSFIWKV